MLEITDQVRDLILKTKKGVQYNKDNKENKNNKDNTCLTNNRFLSSSLGSEACASSPNEVSRLGQEEGALPCYSSQVQAPTPFLCQDMLKSAIIQFFDNGEETAQRYKLKIRLNLVDGEDVEFIANLTKDHRNFKKYIPEECREDIIQLSTLMRKDIKKTFGAWPYIGKFHLNEHSSISRTQIEPWTFACVWWDEEAKGWSGFIKVYEFEYEFDLFNNHLTAKQKNSRVKAQHIWKNPKYDTTPRNKTWAQQRLEKQQANKGEI